MDIQKSLPAIDTHAPSAVTIGTFDGVHFGHRKIIERLLTVASAHHLKTVVLTFFPHPRMVLQQDRGLKLINTLDEKIALLADTGIDELIIHPFTKAFSRLTAEEFVQDVLAERLCAKKVIIGYDHRFGKNRSASIADLRLFADKFHFEVIEIPAEEINEISVSSTKIRNALHEGAIQTANAYLGYPFMLTGRIVKGKGIGKQLTFPTANLQPTEPYKLIPKNGVYVVRSLLDGRLVYGMMNIGFNPTVNGTEQSIEVHFFEVHANLYGDTIQVAILERLRDERRFDSLETLKAQLVRDREQALQFVAHNT